jgi:hypothetical protein
MALQFTRNANVYVQLTDGAATPTSIAVWKLTVLDGFSFTQSINSSEITINEAGTISRRARLLFNDSLAPVEWSMSTYARPFINTTETSPTDQVRCPEEALWAMMLGADEYTSGVFSNSVISDTGSPLEASSPLVNDVNTVGTTTNTFNFRGSNVSSLSDRWNIFFAFEDGTNKQYYKLNKSVVNSASIDFDIDGIATIAWSGFAQALEDLGTSTPGVLAGAITGGIENSDNFIRNRISTLDLEWNQASHSPQPDSYELVLTGGSFSIENNVSYLTPEELGIVNSPLANITGARSISGTLTCYLDNDETNSKSGELFKDLVSDTTTVRNVFNMSINIGGETASTPRIAFDLPTAHLEVPTINVEDLLTLEVNFHGQPSGGNVDNTDEATIIYKA